MKGGQVRVLLYSASVKPVLMILSSGSALVRWLAAQWRGLTGGDAGSNQGSSTKLYDIFYFQSDVDFTGMASHTHGFPG